MSEPRWQDAGFVYCIVHHERQAVKIGFSRDPALRLKQLQVGCADQLDMPQTIPGDRALETAFHRFLKARRPKGEWFDNSDGATVTLFNNVASEAQLG